MNQQISLFDEIKIQKEKDIYNSIKVVVDKFGVDRYYKKYLTDRTYNFHEIKTKLCQLKDYDKYIDELYKELKKYYNEVEDDWTFGKIGISKREQVIIIYNSHLIGPAYCLVMLKNFIKNNVKED